MNITKVVKFFYIIYTIYAILLVNTTTLKFYDLFLPLSLMWFLFIMFKIGYYLKNNKYSNKDRNIISSEWILNISKYKLIFIAILSIVSSILAAYFYTGQTPIKIINAFKNGASLYYEYQNHAMVNEINIFSIKKIPFILMMFYIKFILFYSYIAFFIIKQKINKFDKVYLISITLSHIYFAIARGTNYELFELVMISVFVILSRNNKLYNKKIQVKKIIIIFLIIAAMVYLFYLRVLDRGVILNTNVSKDFMYDENGLVPMITPILSFMVLMIYGYFGFGYVYMSKYISEIWLSSLVNFGAGIFPFGYKLIGEVDLKSKMATLVDIGVKWHPDVAVFMNNWGFLGTIIICLLLGRLSRFAYNQNRDGLCYMTQFYILLQMISFPVGNFVTTSSASILIVVFIIFSWIKRLFKYNKVIKKRQIS